MLLHLVELLTLLASVAGEQSGRQRRAGGELERGLLRRGGALDLERQRADPTAVPQDQTARQLRAVLGLLSRHYHRCGVLQ